MADRLEDLLRGCTVRVIGGPMPGAGFFVAPGRVLTCVHVIGDSAALVVRWERDRQPVLEAPVCRRVAVLAGAIRPIPALDRGYPDIAVLEVDGLDGHPCVSIDLEWPSLEDSFQVFGYPQEGGAVQLTPARLTYRGTHGTHPTAYLDLASDTIKRGMSGAAVLNLRSGKVCGVVVASKHPAHPDGALAIPWSAIDQDLGEVLAANRAFHRQDRRWEAAAGSLRERLRFRLPRVVAHFTGRDNLLAQLDAALSGGRAGVITQAISGLGGVGKTQLAAAYVQAHCEEFDIAAWVRADDGGTADLAELAVALALPVAGRTPAERASDVLVFLANTDRRWLLVFDNAPGPQALAGLPSSGHGRVLVTSRHRGGYDTFGAELAVDVFDPGTARRYLLARSGRTSQEASDAEAVATALGCLPLALAHAGAYCASDTGAPLGDYLQLLEGLPSQDLFDTNREVFYQHTVAATWNTSITAAGQRAPLARRTLQITAYLAPEAIPRSFFAALEEDSAAGRKRVADALAALHRYSLATVAGNRISVHRLLQKVIRDRLAGPEQATAAAQALTAVQRAMPGDPGLPATWPQWQELVPHVATLASIEAVASLNAAQLVSILNPTCKFLLSAGSPPPTLDLATRAAYVSMGHLGPDHPGTLTARANLAMSYQSAGRTGEAIAIGEQVVPDCERLLGPDQPVTLNTLGNLASSYWSAGRTGEAIAILERLAADRERLLGREHPVTLTALGNLAVSYQSAGRTGEALAIKVQVAADSERLLGREHPVTLTALGNLAVSYRSAGRTNEAIAILEQLVADSERLLGPEHPDTLTARAELASSYWSGGRTGEAIGNEEQVAADRERLFGREHPGTLTALGNLAVSYESAGRTDEAIAILERLVADRERLLGPGHPATLTALGNLAVSYHSAGRTGEAIAIEEQVAADSERLLGPGHPGTLTALGNLAASYQSAGRIDEALGIEERLVVDRERLLGPGHPGTLTARANLASSYRSAGRIGEAIAILEEVAADFERLLGSGHPSTLTARANLASSYWSAGRLDEALGIEERLVADRERLLGSGHPGTLTARANLASSYRSAGRIGEAIAILEQVAADFERLLGSGHPSTLTTRGNLASSYRSAGRTGEAIAILERVAADREHLLGPDHPDTLTTRANLATAKTERDEKSRRD
jgi:tetratricopeptide (TPR) repeat protein